MQHQKRPDGDDFGGLSRRGILCRGLAAAGAAGGLQAFASVETATAPRTPRPCPPAAWRKHGVILEATESWEGGEIQNFTSPAEPLGGGRWRLWYSARGSRKSFELPG